MRGRFWPNFEAIKWCSGPLLPTDRDRRRGVGLVKYSAYLSPESPNFIQHLRFIVGIHPLIGGSSPRQSPFLRLTPKFSFGQIVVVPPQLGFLIFGFYCTSKNLLVKESLLVKVRQQVKKDLVKNVIMYNEAGLIKW